MMYQAIQRWDIDNRRMLPAPRQWLTDPSSLTLAANGATLAAHDQIVDRSEGEDLLDSVELALVPSGKRLAICKNLNVGGRRRPASEQRGSVQLVDLELGLTELEFKCDQKQIQKLAFSPNARLLASINGNGTISLWERYTGQEVWHQKAPKVSCMGFSPDGRLLATGGSDQTVRLWDLEVFKPAGELRGHLGEIKALLFSSDGRQLASASADTTVLFWDVAAARKERSAAKDAPLTSGEIKLALRELGGGDGAKAYRAMQGLASAPRETTARLASRLSPAPNPDLERVAEWLRDLDSPRFTDRTRAQRALSRLGRSVRGSLQAALRQNNSLERRRRLEALLKQTLLLSGTDLFCLRAVELLERIGTQEAVTLLRRLAGGAPAAWLTEEAQLSLNRLSLNQR